MKFFRIALAQMNSTVGDLKGNLRKIYLTIKEAKKQGADLIAFPEMAIPGYPPEDLLLRPRFITDNLKALDELKAHAIGITVVVGFVDRRDDIYNAAAVLHGGVIAGVYHKIYLPNYGVFDEERYFQRGHQSPVFVVEGVRVGINICEDIWYPDGPTVAQALGGEAEVIINISASPYHAGKGKYREKMLATRAKDNAVIVAYLNMIGGQDELIFDGDSLIFNQEGGLLVRGKQFEEELILADLNIDEVLRVRLHDPRRRKDKLLFLQKESNQLGSAQDGIPIIEVSRTQRIAQSKRKGAKKTPLLTLGLRQPLHPLEEIYQALTIGVRDYVRKNCFSKATIGLSGGIDSALTACIAVDALGRENVIGVFMPSQYTSLESQEDVQILSKNLQIELITLPIWDIFQSYLKMLESEFKGKPVNVTEENLQARIRGNLLMALSNKFGWLVLTTGNKSEMSVGYATLYGDMAGGFSVIKDVPKTLVYELSRHRNARDRSEIVPARIFERPPTAELKPNQTDQDTLPPYEILDPILQAYVEEDKTFEEIVAMGYGRSVVEKVVELVDRSEYKRRQSPPGIKITPRALGKDRRMPVTHRYREIS
ncbi:MAG: NAD+ synthase [Nitrospira sp.]|nr:NAD+ synthase [Nitrospira sp.]